MLGSRITAVAYPLLVLAITGSPLIAGWSTFAVVAPCLLVYLPAGVLVDRWDPRRVMFASELGRGVALGSIVLGMLLGNLGLLELIVAAASDQALGVFANLAEPRFLRSLVRPDQAPSALVRGETRNHLSVLFGRPAGALLFGMGPVYPFAAGTFSFLVSLIALFHIRNGRSEDHRAVSHMVTEMRHKLRGAWIFVASLIAHRSIFPVHMSIVPQADGSHPRDSMAVSMIADIRDGFSWLGSNLYACGGLLLTTGTTFVSQALIMVFFAEVHSRGIPLTKVGIVLAASGVGGVVGSAAASRLFPRFGYKLLQGQMVMWVLTFGFLAFAGGGPSYWHFAIAMAVLGFAGALGNISINTYMALHADTRLARVLSIDRLTSFLALALGPAVGGLLVAKYGVHSTVIILFCLAVPLGVGKPVGRALFRYLYDLQTGAEYYPEWAAEPAIEATVAGDRRREPPTRLSSRTRETASEPRNAVRAGVRTLAAFAFLLVAVPLLVTLSIAMPWRDGIPHSGGAGTERLHDRLRAM
jgi:MFS family permease